MTAITGADDARIFAPPPAARPNDELGQEDFLTLMITQFRNQDPFEPMDNGDFLGQLAQFSTVSGLENLNSQFSGLASSIQGDQALQAAGLVGRSVLAITNVGRLADTGSLNGAVEIYEPASNIQVDIVDETGELVKTINLGEQQDTGLVRFSWDGTDSEGNRAEPGQYQVRARVIRGAETESTPTLIEASIESVTLGQFGNGVTLNLAGGGAMSLAQVYQII